MKGKSALMSHTLTLVSWITRALLWFFLSDSLLPMAGPIHRTDHYDLFFSPNSLPLPPQGPDCLRSPGWQLRLASPPIPPAEHNSHQLLTSPPHICPCRQELIRHYKTLLICLRKLLVKINLCSLFLSLCVFVCPSLFSTCAHMCAYACACARTHAPTN